MRIDSGVRNEGYFVGVGVYNVLKMSMTKGRGMEGYMRIYTYMAQVVDGRRCGLRLGCWIFGY